MQISDYIPFNVPLFFDLTHFRCLGKNPYNNFDAFLENVKYHKFFWDYLTFSIPQMSNEHLKKGQFVFPTLYCELGIFIIFTLFCIPLIWLFNLVNWLWIDNLFFSSPNNSVLHQLKPDEPVQSRNYLKKVVMKRWKIWQTYSTNTRIHLGLFLYLSVFVACITFLV